MLDPALIHCPFPACGSLAQPAHRPGHDGTHHSPPSTSINELTQIVILFLALPHNLNNLILETITFNYLQTSMKSESIQSK